MDGHVSFGGRAPGPRMDHGRPQLCLGRPIGSGAPRKVWRGEEARCEGRLGVRPNSDVSVYIYYIYLDNLFVYIFYFICIIYIGIILYVCMLVFSCLVLYVFI